MTPLEAQRALEAGLEKARDFEEAVAWLNAHPEVAENLTQESLLSDFWAV